MIFRIPLPSQRMRSASWRNALAMFLVMALLIPAFVPTTHAQDAAYKVLPQLLREANANPRGTFRVTIQRLNRNTQADNDTVANGGTKVRNMSIDAFVANVPGKAISGLSQNPNIKFISYDAPLRKTASVDASRLATSYPAVVNASQLWSGTTPVTGAGVGVAVLDTGINGAADWKDANGNSRVAAKVYFNDANSAMPDSTMDQNGHGTHVAGIIAGNSWKSGTTAVQGKYVGIAPEAKIIAVRASDSTGKAYTSDVVDGIEWIIANRTQYNIRVLNMSLVSGTAESYKTSLLAAAVERAWFNGIFVVVAAGNDGANTMQYAPANDPFVMTVGASDSIGTVARTDDGMAPWSSYGTTQDGVSKPEVVAPGRYIAAPLASSTSTFAKNFPTRISDTNYIWMSGTSMSAPVVSGIAALAFQKHPEWTNDQVKWLLMNTATRLGGATPGQGAGLVDAAAVVTYSGALQYANQGLTHSLNLVTTDGTTTYNSASWNSASWNSASWNSASWNSSSWATANDATSSWATATEKGVE